MTSRPLLPLVLALLLAGCADAPAPDADAADTLATPPPDTVAVADEAWTVSAARFGPFRFGMTLEEASEAAGEPVEAGPDDVSPGCSYTSTGAMPPGTMLMVVEGDVARVDVMRAGVATAAGIEVGATAEAVRQAYPGRIRTEPHPYMSPDGHYLVYTPPDSATARPPVGLIFETAIEDGQERVTSYRGGRYPELQWIEGCA